MTILTSVAPAGPAAAPDQPAPRLLVDLAAIADNTRILADLAGRSGAGLMAVVKADGFGHGAVEVARTALAAGATSLGVTSLQEAAGLRDAGLTAPILSWLNAVDADHAWAITEQVDLGVPGREHLAALLAAARGAPGRPIARIHLHLDTGLARDGTEPGQWARLCREARRAEQEGLVRVVGLMGHLACADHPEDPANALGRTRFAWGLETARGCGLRPALRHLAATSATLTDPRAHHTLVRVGAGLVGIDPTGTTALRPALTLTAPVVGVRGVRPGTSVGYAHAWTTPRRTTLGLVALGYADGLPRAAAGRAEVQVRGVRCPIVGRVSMDQVVVDLGPGSTVRTGETVTVFGPGTAGEPTVADWARWAGTIEHEIVTGLGTRVPRTHLAASRLRSVR